MTKTQHINIITANRKAKHDYFIINTYEAGLVLQGTEVKSLRAKRASFTDSFATIDDGEVWLRGLHISEYSYGSWTNHIPTQKRKLLLHKREIAKLIGKTKTNRITLVPLKLYFNAAGKIKVELALAQGKKQYDKRQALAERSAKMDMQRAFRNKAKNSKIKF